MEGVLRLVGPAGVRQSQVIRSVCCCCCCCWVPHHGEDWSVEEAPVWDVGGRGEVVYVGGGGGGGCRSGVESGFGRCGGNLVGGWEVGEGAGVGRVLSVAGRRDSMWRYVWIGDAWGVHEFGGCMDGV